MTTIAYRDGVLAADSLITASDIRQGTTRKIGRYGDILAAFSGNVGNGQKWLAWVEAGMDGEPPDLEGATGVLFLPDGEIILHHEHGSESRRTPVFGLGTGGDLARAAMLAGATPKEAVKTAIKLDIYSGGPVRVITRS